MVGGLGRVTEDICGVQKGFLSWGAAIPETGSTGKGAGSRKEDTFSFAESEQLRRLERSPAAPVANRAESGCFSKMAASQSG